MSNEDMGYMPNTTGNTNCGFPVQSGWHAVTINAPAAGSYVGDVPWTYQPPLAPGFQQPVYIQPMPPVTEEQVRRIVEDALQRVLYPDGEGMVDPRHFARVTLETDTGEIWRGMVYPVERTE